MNLTDFNTDGRLGHLTAGESITVKDSLELCGLTGKAIKIQVSDFASVGNMSYGTAQTNAASGQIIAQTSLVAGTPTNSARLGLLHHSQSKEIFTLNTTSTNTGYELNRFDASGGLLATITNATGVAVNNCTLLELSNGNIVALLVSNAATLFYIVYDSNLVEIKAITTIASVSTEHFAAVALSGGGFAAVYQDSATPILSKLVTYDNTGTAVLAATTIWTRTGTTGAQYHKIKQLTSGDLAVAVSSVNTVSSIGLYYGVVTTAGVPVLAFTVLDTASCAWYPELSVSTSGYFCISRPNGTNQLAYVFNDAGTQQGTTFTSATSAGNANNKTKLLWDGSNFYLIWHKNSGSLVEFTKLPITGAASASTTAINTSTTQYNFYIDAFYDSGYIVAVSQDGTTATAPTLWVIDVARMALVSASETIIGTAAGTASGAFIRLLSGGDRAFIAMYNQVNAALTALCAGKWARTAVIGVAATNASVNSTVAIKTLAGCYQINAIKGSFSKSFDMTTNALVGNKGAILTGGAMTLRGIGA